jgi:hypothetical protein
MSSTSNGKAQKARRKTMKKNIFIYVAFLAVMLLAAGNLSAINTQNSFKKTQLTLRGGLNMFSVNGADSDYVAGTNDFPVNPAYNATVFGIGLTFFTSPSFAIGFDVRYGFAAKVDLRDPSDGEIVNNVDTPKNLIASFNLYKYFNLSQQMQIFVSLGGGGEYRMADDIDYTGSLGSKIIIAIAKPFSPLAAGGIGFKYMFTDSLGVSLEFQGDYIFRTPAQILISPTLGINLKF